MAVVYVLAAALWLYFLPVFWQDLFSGKWQLQKIRRRRAQTFYHRFGFEKWAREENETRRKRVWKNRNSFYKT